MRFGKTVCKLNMVCGHIDREHIAKGLCQNCYNLQRYNLNKEENIARVIAYHKTSEGHANKIKNQKKYYEFGNGKLVTKKYLSSPKGKLAMKEAEKKNALMIRLGNNKYRALKHSTADGSVTTQSILNLFKTQNGLCNNPNCKVPLEDNYHIDHRFPLSKGGKHIISNIQLLCPFCNISKKDKVVEYAN